jgi:outer membrane protein assembly factor BamB
MSRVGLRAGRAVRLLGLLLALTLPVEARADDDRGTWPQWRGLNRDGHVGGPEWPASLQGDNLKQLWRVPLGPSYSGPVVTQDRVFVLETKDKTWEVVHAYERDTGKELWSRRWKGYLKPPNLAKSHGDWIRSTPAYADGRLYVAGMRDVLVCLDARTGAEIWRDDFVARFKTPVPAYGFACSPLVDGDAVYVQAAAAVVKVDKHTGNVLWRSFPDDRGPNGNAVSSPVMAMFGGKRQLVVQNRRKLGGLDPDTGAVLWVVEVPAVNNMNVISPLPYHDAVFTSAYGSRSFLFAVGRQDGHWAAHKLWDNKAQCFMSTPVAVGDYVYMHLRNQRLTCLDLKTGKQCWISPEPFGQYWSMVVQKDRVLGLDQRGILYLLRANPKKFEVLDSRPVSDAETWAHLAVAGDQLFVRELHAITAFRWRQAGPAAARQ